jgi:hypothetical protein
MPLGNLGGLRWVVVMRRRVVPAFFVSLFALVISGPSSAQTLQDIGRALDALAGPQAPARPNATPRPPAAGRADCDAYARDMVRLDMDARSRNCRGWNSHSNFDGHRTWCQRGGDARGALARWNQRYGAMCDAQAARPGPAAVPNRASSAHCDDYAVRMSNMNRIARDRRCVGWNGHSDERGHRSWCLARPAQASTTALGSWRARYDTCLRTGRVAG